MHLSEFIRAVGLVCVVIGASHSFAAKPTEAEKAKKAAEKKLDAFEKSYDPAKGALSRKNPERLAKDIEELDAALSALKAVDEAGASELAPRRDALVTATSEGVSSARAGKNDEIFTKHFSKLQEQFDPEKKRLENVDAAAIKRARDEIDRDIAKFDEAGRKPYEEKRDAFFAKLANDITAAKVTKLHSELAAPVPQLKAVAGADTIGPMKPTWCDGVEAALAKVYENYHVPGLSNGDVVGAPAFINAATFSCFDQDFDVRQQWVAWFRQSLSNQYGLNAATSARLLKHGAALAISGDVDKQRKEACAQFDFLKTGTAEARMSRKLERAALGCGTPAGEGDDLSINAIDVPNGLSSQLAAAGLATRLTTQGFHSNDGKLTGFAVANAVIHLDAAAFEKELLAWKLNDAGTIAAVVAFYSTVEQMKALTAEARARNAAVLLDAPKRGAEAFTAALANTQSAINVALALEDQKRAGTLAGCATKLYPELQAAVKGEKASLEQLRLDGLLAYKLAFCGLNDPEAPTMERVFGYYAQRTVPVRGPFTAAYLALLEAHNSGAAPAAKAGFDPGSKRGAASTDKGPFVPEANPLDPPDIGHFNTMSPELLPAGVVQAVERQGALTRITFRTEHYMVPVIECHETNKIDRVASDGTILYRSDCRTVGEKEATATNEPITVPSYAAQGVAPGAFLRYESAPVNDDVKGQPHRGWVVEAYESKARKTRTSLFGLVP